jgi:hypothetical protein
MELIGEKAKTLENGNTSAQSNVANFEYKKTFL